jgi:hypothetical protein
VIRGTLHPTQTMELSAAASHALMADLELSLLSSEEIYGGKLVAALDPQHPRDLVSPPNGAGMPSCSPSSDSSPS